MGSDPAIRRLGTSRSQNSVREEVFLGSRADIRRPTSLSAESNDQRATATVGTTGCHAIGKGVSHGGS